MKTNFLFLAAENDAILNCKAGGMADVVRDVPRQIAKKGDTVSVITPSYNRLHQGGVLKSGVSFLFRNHTITASVYEVAPKKEYDGIKHYVIHHPEIIEGNIAHIYNHDEKEPFFNDANKFAIFCTAAASAISKGVFGIVGIVHLHDWHTALLLFLAKFDAQYTSLKSIRFVFSIHNLAIQGIRPLRENPSSLYAWFPKMEIDESKITDKRYPDCINLMAVGIRFADAVHTVSPSYKKDVLKPSNPPEFIGGEGLEEDLLKADKEKRLFGILNGCNYKGIRKAKSKMLFINILKGIFTWLQEPYKKYKADYLTHTGDKVTKLLKSPPGFIISSVARLTEQKFFFFKKSPEVLRLILQELKSVNGVYVLLGTGVPEYEQLFRTLSYEHTNFIFVNGQSEDIIDSIYHESDVYLMPSLFEPCGISQMLAMRNSCPCLVHNTGGLKDTIVHMETGFSFDGNTYDEKVANFVAVFYQVLELYQNKPEVWKSIRKNAKSQRFTWQDAVDQYYKKLYGILSKPRTENKQIDRQNSK